MYGSFAYTNETLDSAVRAVFAVNKAPAGYSLDAATDLASLSAATNITPAISAGDDLALLLNQACLLAITGEDGAMVMRTRSLTVEDKGERKRDLLARLGEQIYEIENGGAVVFATQQSLANWLIANGGSDVQRLWAAYSNANTSGLGGGTVSVGSGT